MGIQQRDIHAFSNLSANSPAFNIHGGKYALIVHATAWTSGSVKLQVLADDGVTYVPVDTGLTADGVTQYNALPQGTYQIAVATATGVYASLRSTELPQG